MESINILTQMCFQLEVNVSFLVLGLTSYFSLCVTELNIPLLLLLWWSEPIEPLPLTQMAAL